MAEAPRRSGRDASLDGMRGIAAFAVVLSHVAHMTAFTWDGRPVPMEPWAHALWLLGMPAVDLFFVLSGYVVTRSLMERPTRYPPYVVGRFARLAPIAWVGVVLALAMRALSVRVHAGTLPTDALSRITGPDLLGYATLVWPVPTGLVNPPLWSVFVEMQAALAMPVMALVSRRWRRALLPASALVIALAMIASGSDYALRFGGFVAGALCAAHHDDVPRLRSPAAAMAIGLAILLVRHLTGDLGEIMRIPGSVGAAIMVLAARQGACAGLLRGRASQRLGETSYPLYAIHYPIMAAATSLAGHEMGTAAAAICSIPLSLAVARLLTRTVDRRAIAFSGRMRRAFGGGRLDPPDAAIEPAP